MCSDTVIHPHVTGHGVKTTDATTTVSQGLTTPYRARKMGETCPFTERAHMSAAVSPALRAAAFPTRCKERAGAPWTRCLGSLRRKYVLAATGPPTCPPPGPALTRTRAHSRSHRSSAARPARLIAAHVREAEPASGQRGWASGRMHAFGMVLYGRVAYGA